jgi:hypothetical protein
LKPLVKIEEEFDREKILCTGCPSSDIHGKHEPKSKILREKIDLNNYRLYVKDLLKNEASNFSHPNKPKLR